MLRLCAPKSKSNSTWEKSSIQGHGNQRHRSGRGAEHWPAPFPFFAGRGHRLAAFALELNELVAQLAANGSASFFVATLAGVPKTLLVLASQRCARGGVRAGAIWG
jgi:hypothetical protein